MIVWFIWTFICKPSFRSYLLWLRAFTETQLLDKQFGFGVEPLPAFGREPTVSLLQGADDVKATCLVSES